MNSINEAGARAINKIGFWAERGWGETWELRDESHGKELPSPGQSAGPKGHDGEQQAVAGSYG